MTLPEGTGKKSDSRQKNNKERRKTGGSMGRLEQGSKEKRVNCSILKNSRESGAQNGLLGSI